MRRNGRHRVRWHVLVSRVPCYLAAVLLPAMAAAMAPGESPAGAMADEAKPRLVVMTDIGGDPDDRQSMVRFLLYACDFEVEGLCTGFGFGHYEVTRPELIREAVDAYGEVLANLRKHRFDQPLWDSLGLVRLLAAMTTPPRTPRSARNANACEIQSGNTAHSLPSRRHSPAESF